MSRQHHNRAASRPRANAAATNRSYYADRAKQLGGNAGVARECSECGDEYQTAFGLGSVVSCPACTKLWREEYEARKRADEPDLLEASRAIAARKLAIKEKRT